MAKREAKRHIAFGDSVGFFLTTFQERIRSQFFLKVWLLPSLSLAAVKLRLGESCGGPEAMAAAGWTE